MTQAELFEELGAPLQNERWSWGCVREFDKCVFLRIWQEGTKHIDGKRFVWVSDVVGADESLGARERLEHIGLIRDGYASYLVLCETGDVKYAPSGMTDFKRVQVFVGGALIEMDDGYWLELGGQVPFAGVAVRT